MLGIVGSIMLNHFMTQTGKGDKAYYTCSSDVQQK